MLELLGGLVLLVLAICGFAILVVAEIRLLLGGRGEDIE